MQSLAPGRSPLHRLVEEGTGLQGGEGAGNPSWELSISCSFSSPFVIAAYQDPGLVSHTRTVWAGRVVAQSPQMGTKSEAPVLGEQAARHPLCEQVGIDVSLQASLVLCHLPVTKFGHSSKQL